MENHSINEYDTNEFAHKHNREEKPEASFVSNDDGAQMENLFSCHSALRCTCAWRKRILKG